MQVNDRRTLNEITAGIIDFNVDKVFLLLENVSILLF